MTLHGTQTLKIMLSGCFGRMGRAVAAGAAECGDEVVCGVDFAPGTADFPTYPSLDLVMERADVIIDFSFHTFTPELLRFAAERGIPAVIATTGHNDEEREAINAAAQSIPVFYSRNMSLGANALVMLAARAARALGQSWDVEIIEEHHNRKLDAPSGTALMIAEAVRDVREKEEGTESRYVYDRHLEHRARESAEIGIHTVRAGGIVGEHEILFASGQETIRISHSAYSREVFADGALRAAHFLSQLTAPGLYSMRELLEKA